MKKRKEQSRAKGRAFWNREYANASHLALSTKPSEDLIAFLRWFEREHPDELFGENATVLDVGCGNGRNLVYLADEYGVTGSGFDISREAIGQAQSDDLDFYVGSLADPLQNEDESVDLVLDMMASHVLKKNERANLEDEIVRVLRPGGWLFMKTFLLDEDRNAKRMLRDYPADEPGSYIHPAIGIVEHVYTEKELVSFLEPDFTIHRLTRSHQHLRGGKAFKRRSMCVYAQKKEV
ncbi:MAG: class I SAM-dependent methyltransferase [bacterium]|nr:class I SAM-dependent methyltransferase [bacterium]